MVGAQSDAASPLLTGDSGLTGSEAGHSLSVTDAGANSWSSKTCGLNGIMPVLLNPFIIFVAELALGRASLNIAGRS